jgi:hypothetical protein
MSRCEAFKSPCWFFPVMNAFPININKREFTDFRLELMVFELFVFIIFLYISLILSTSSWSFVSLSSQTFISSKSSFYLPQNGFDSTTFKTYQYPWRDLKKNHITNIFTCFQNFEYCFWAWHNALK